MTIQDIMYGKILQDAADVKAEMKKAPVEIVEERIDEDDDSSEVAMRDNDRAEAYEARTYEHYSQDYS